MLILLSPTKQMEFNRHSRFVPELSDPPFLREAFELNGLLERFSPSGIAGLMNTSEKLAESTCALVGSFGKGDCGRGPAMLSYSGTVFQHMDVPSMNREEWEYAAGHVRILSGLFGYLRPADRVFPYRLEMKTALKNREGAGLYPYWRGKITRCLAEENQPVLNLASGEYGKAVNWKELKVPVLSIQFREKKGDRYSTVGMYSKMARGKMAGLLIRRGIDDWNDLKDLDLNGYIFNDELSTEKEWIFSGNWRM
ncbi:MAG: YaaA family protein [Spirochaetales bacterium]|nr:YaaA family protein [Spirochaetales bacterium]